MVLRNVRIYTEDKEFQNGIIYIRNGLFEKIEIGTEIDMEMMPEEEIFDGNGCYAIPGLIDIHFHGCVGADFCDGTKDAIEKIAKYEASQGVTTIVPATMTLSEEELIKIMRCAGEYEGETGAILAGINMEGPFISVIKKGAQSAKHICKPDIELFRRLQRAANGKIQLCDIAPEEEGAMEFIEALKDEVKISFAHTAADYEIAKKGYNIGACHATHLYNGMLPFAHRKPGVVGAARDSAHVYVELICDGIHVHPSVVRATFEMFGAERIIMISDSMRATGLCDGEYTLGGQVVNVRGKFATLVSDGALAGSCTNLMDCVRIAVKEMGIPLEVAIACATMNPAKSIGMYDKYGSISVGKVGNVVLLNKELELKAVFVRGEII